MSTPPQGFKHPKAGLYLKKKLFDGISRFVDLEQRIADLPTKQERGDAFEVFAEAYLSTQLLYQAKNVWSFSTVPLAIKDRFALGQSDVGVDGVFETHLGEFHAYQAKFRTGRPSLTWDELSTFMGLTDQIAERVVITNCNELSEVASDRRGFYAIRGTDLDRLQDEDFEAIRHWLAGAAVEHKRKTPLPRQQDALDAVVKTLSEQDRATTLMPCGTGKTLVALWVAERLGSQKILVLVPSLALVSQTLHEWLKETQWRNPSFLCVCSDPTVTSRAEDTLVLHQADVDFPVTCDTQTVQTFLERKAEGVKVVFCTYQSARVVADGMGKSERFDFAIFDEAHKTAGREGAQFGFALKDANLPISKRLCMTATPRHYDVRKRDKEGDAKLVYSMDAPEIYGPVAYRLSFAQAVEEKMICGYKIIISVITSEMVNDEMLRRGAVVVKDDLVKARQVANELVVKDAIERYVIKKVITFHKSVAAAASFITFGPEGIGAHVPDLTVFHVNGTMSSGTRDPIMRAFAEAERALISNARCLTEGIDVPAVDMVAFLTPKRSLVDIVQATGRAMRKSARTNKTHGYVLVPLYLELAAGESIEQAVARSVFDEVWTVLQALQEHDEVLAEIIRLMRDVRGRKKGFDDQRFRERIEVVGPSLSLDVLRYAIATKIVERIGSDWDERFHELMAFKEQHGNIRVFSNPHLSGWMSRQRSLHRRGRLSNERKAKLDSVGFGWLQVPRTSAWDEGLKTLGEYKKQHNNCHVPWNCRLTYGVIRFLYEWVWEQRTARALNRLDSRRVKRLELLGFEWKESSQDWESAFSELSAFAQKHGHCCVSLETNGRGQASEMLALWLGLQRRSRELGILGDEKERKLEMLPHVWDDTEPRLANYFLVLQEFRRVHGHPNASRFKENHADAFSILKKIRELKLQGKLGSKWQCRFDTLEVVWDTAAAPWEELVSELLDLERQYGPCESPYTTYPIVKTYLDGFLGRYSGITDPKAEGLRQETKKELDRLFHVQREEEG